MIATFVIFLREGVEASTIVAILLAYLDQTGQRRHFRDVFAGVAAAAVLMVVGGIAAYLLVSQYAGSTVQTVFETITYLVAVAVLTYMTFWMQSHGRTLGTDLRSRSEEALAGRTRFGLGALSFQAVGREGLETVVFTLAIVFASAKQAPVGSRTVHGLPGGLLLLGAVLGLVVSLAIAVAIYRLGRRLNMALFFRIVGVALMVVAAGLLADAVENMQQLGWLPFGTHALWDTSRLMSEDSSIGDLFHVMVGYAERPTLLQGVAWIAYVGGAVTAFVTMGRRTRRQSATAGDGSVPLAGPPRQPEASAPH